MLAGDPATLIRKWGHAFGLLASLECGRFQPWSGPDNTEELKLRVETLALLLAVVPRSELGYLEDVVIHLAATYISLPLPTLSEVRTEIRALLAQRTRERPDRDNYYKRAASVVARKAEASRPSTETAVDQSGNRQQDYELCSLGIGTWLTQLNRDPKWTHLRMLAADERETPVDEVFVEVFAVLDDDLEDGSDLHSERVRRVAGRFTGETHAVVDAATMVARTSTFCVVVGDPGSGKSTLVQWIARNIAKETRENVEEFEAALVVKLGPFALTLAETPDNTLMEYFFDTLGTKIDDWSGAAQWLRNAAQEGARYLLLLDGWDEVPPVLQDRVRQRIDLERPYFTIITTSRPSGFPRRLATGRNAEVYHIAGLTPEGQRALGSRYLRALGRESALAHLLQQIESNRDLQELACNPFMLALLTRAAAFGRLTSPAGWTMTELYRLAAGWIIDVSAEQNTGDHARLSRSQDGLRSLSNRLLFGEPLPRYVFSLEELTREVDAPNAEAIVKSRFITRVDRLGHQFAFLHATFEEYFAACHFESLSGRSLDEHLERAFLSASRGIVLDFVVGLASAPGQICRARLERWMGEQDRYGQVLFRVARLMAACPARERSPALVAAIATGLWKQITGTRELTAKESAIKLFARLDPVGLCRAVRSDKAPDQYVVDCITTAVPPAVGIAEGIADLMDPALRERVEAELWGGRTRERVEDTRRVLHDSSSALDQLRDAAVFAGAARDVDVVPALVALLRRSSSEELQHELATSLGLIGGADATRALVDLVTGDIEGASVAAGLARRALQHSEDGRRRLDPPGRDALLRRVASLPISETGRPLLMLSALNGYPLRVGSKLLKHWAFSRDVPNIIRFECLQVLEASLPDAELDELLQRIQGEPAEIEALLLSAAVRRRRPIPVKWLSGRLRTSLLLQDKSMLLTVALAMSAHSEFASAEANQLLREMTDATLSSSDPKHDDLAAALRSAVAEAPLDVARSPTWIDSNLCTQVLQAFLDRDHNTAADRVMLAATLFGRVPARESAELLQSCLSHSRQRLEEPLEPMQAKLLAEVARAIALSLAHLDPQSLLSFPPTWPPVDETLHTLSNRWGWLVYDNQILSREGNPVLPRWRHSAVTDQSKDGKADRGKSTTTESDTQATGGDQILPLRLHAAAAKPQPDILVVTVNVHETRALQAAVASATGRGPTPIPVDGRVYTDLGALNGTRIFHALSEMGSGSVGAMQQSVNVAIRALDPAAVIALGIAFGVNERKQQIGDILISKQLGLYELQRQGGEITLRDDKPHASARLINFFNGFAQRAWNGDSRVSAGVILSGNKLVDNLDYRQQLTALESEAVGGEMEGAGLYVACQEHRKDWIVIKSICDWADGHKSTNKTQRQLKAAANAAQFFTQALQYAPWKLQT